MTYNMGFGDSFVIREALEYFIDFEMLFQTVPYLGYADTKGDAELENHIKEFVKLNTGLDYNHVVITSGANMAIAASLQAMEKLHSSKVYFDDLHFLKYPHLVKAMNMLRVDKEEFLADERVIQLTASPANPTGELNLIGDKKRTIWDACYHNQIYISPVSSVHTPLPDHALSVGSMGKVTGMNGIRIGWVATNSETLARTIRERHYIMTLSVPTNSLEVVRNFFQKVDVERFMAKSWSYLCDNRHELSKLEYLFESPVNPKGMFWFTKTDKSVKDLLVRAGVTFIEGVECGGTEDHIRITLGQDRKLTRAMVMAVRKLDGK